MANSITDRCLEADDAWPIIDLFESLDVSAINSEVVAAALPAIDRVIEMQGSATISFAAQAIVLALKARNEIEIAKEVLARSLNALRDQQDDGFYQAMIVVVGLAASPLDENGIGHPEIVHPHIDFILSADTDNSHELEGLCDIIAQNKLLDLDDFIKLAKKLEEKDLSATQLCKLAMNVNGDNEKYIGGWNLGDAAWATEILRRAEPLAKARGEKQDLNLAKEVVGIS
jgi:hypothetical protein